MKDTPLIAYTEAISVLLQYIEEPKANEYVQLHHTTVCPVLLVA